jgi:HEAT repeat protein
MRLVAGPWLFALLVLLVGHPVTLSPARGEQIIDSPMYKSPDLPGPTVVPVFPEKAKDLWLRALERPEADYRYKAAETIAQAHRRGMKGLESTIPRLLAALDRPDQDTAVRLAAAQALITLDARDTAPSLLKQAQVGGTDLRLLVEPALAKWDYKPARAVWLERVRDPAASQASLFLAIQGLAAVREEKAAEPLRAIALSHLAPGPVRLEAARALGGLRREGLEKDAARLAADASPRGLPGRLVAAALLHQHQGEAAVKLLQGLAGDPEPAVAAPAVARLLEIDPNLLLPVRDDLLGSRDARLRSLAVEVLLRLPNDEHLRLLGDRLDDPHPDVRAQARRSLQALAGKPEWRPRVLAEGTRVLATENWRGVEQAAILLTGLDHKPAVGRLLALLTFPRAEVAVTAGWALRRLAVPETLPAITKYVGATRRRAFANASEPEEGGIPIILLDFQLAQLNQLLGLQKYAAAEPVLREYVPRMAISLGGGARGPAIQVLPEARAAAIWALGLLHEGKADAELATALETRLKEGMSMPPEDERVCLMSAIALGRMRAKEQLPTLQKFYAANEPTASPINNASGWAVAQITGKPMTPPRTIHAIQRDWFLTPTD